MTVIGYTTGVFDLFHIGHLNILRNAKRNCDFLIVGVTTDELAESAKGKKPIIPFAERMEIVGNIKYVDQVVAQENYDKFDAWNKLHFNRMFVGDDWKGSDKWNAIEKQFREVGVEIEYFPYTKQTSSTKIRKILDIFEAFGEGGTMPNTGSRIRSKASKFLDHYKRMNSVMEKKFGYSLFFIGGTLLGFVRERDFLANDYDMDVSYFSKYEKVADVRLELVSIVNELIDSGEDIHLIRPNYTAVTNYFRWSFDERDRIDVMPMWFQDGWIYRPTFVAYQGNKDIILPLHEEKFYGYDVNIPNKPETKLANVYGDDWRIPNPEFKKRTRKNENTKSVVAGDLRYAKEQWRLIRKTKQWASKSLTEKLIIKTLYLRSNKFFATIIPSYKFFRRDIFRRLRPLIQKKPKTLS